MSGKKTIERLKSRIQETFGQEIRTPKDFENLSESVFRHTGVLMSTTTFKRLWGYINENVTPRRSTLDTLAKFVGYHDWNVFCGEEAPEIESGIVANDCINVSRQLKEGDKIRLTWLPNRVCDIEYLGNTTFKIIYAEGTKLAVGSTFSCSLIINGEPLYLDNLISLGHSPATYICGRRHGIHFAGPKEEL